MGAAPLGQNASSWEILMWPAAVKFNSIFHPSDFSSASEVAFAHALRIAMAGEQGAELVILHAAADNVYDAPWQEFPAVRGTLERWGHLEPSSPREAVFEKLGVVVTKVSSRGSNALRSIVKYLEGHPTDLIVLATDGREGAPRWVRPSVSEPLPRLTRTMTLFVRNGARGFVAPDDGHVTLRRIVIPIDHDPPPELAIEAAARAATALSKEPVEMLLVYVGVQRDTPDVEVPDEPRFSCERIVRQGDVVDALIGVAEERRADLIAMATRGKQGFLDALRGSTTQRVLRRAPCPVLAVPLV
jgi:nucleotide-binding universal stress UspA family protein